MAVLIINDEDFSQKLKDFSLSCKNCESKNVKLDIDWANYPSCSWFKVLVICNDCLIDEEIYSTH